jgi:hypothetical protein
MTIHKVYPELRCEVCGNVLETEEPETEHVFLLLVKPCYVCDAQLRAAVGRLEGERDALREGLADAETMFFLYAELHRKGKLKRPEWADKLAERGELARAVLEAAALAADGERGTG